MSFEPRGGIFIFKTKSVVRGRRGGAKEDSDGWEEQGGFLERFVISGEAGAASVLAGR